MKSICTEDDKAPEELQCWFAAIKAGYITHHHESIYWVSCTMYEHPNEYSLAWIRTGGELPGHAHRAGLSEVAWGLDFREVPRLREDVRM